MREQEMRQRAERFLQTRLRQMLLPATLGLGLAMGGCADDAMSADDGGNADVGAVSVKYMAQLPDSAPAVRYMAQMPDAAPDLGMIAIYMAQLPVPRG